MVELLGGAALLIFIYVTVVFVLSILYRRNDIADIAWGLGFVVVAVFLFLKQGLEALSPSFLLVFALIVLWGVRLSVYLFFRNRKKSEDFRYREWREAWGRNIYVRSFFQVFLLQGFLMLVISTPLFLLVLDGTARVGLAGYFGLVTWATGFFFQVVGDWQLARFKKRSVRGEVMQYGLWKFTRHPNYFGEILMWWGIFFITLPVVNGFWGAVSPLVLTWLLVRVSGIPMLEEKYKGVSAYEDYCRRTSALIPLPPRKDSTTS